MNRVILLGNLTREPELRNTPRGADVCALGLAVNRTFTDGEGNRQEEVSFIDAEAWGRRGEVITEYLHKGDPLLIEGRLKQERWQDQEGQNRSKVKVIVENFQFVGNRSAREDSDAAGQSKVPSSASSSGSGGRGRKVPQQDQQNAPQNERRRDSGRPVAAGR